MTRKPERTRVRLVGRSTGIVYGELQACDVHGNGRSNKCWIGKLICGREVDLPNLKEVAAFAKKNDLLVKDFVGPMALASCRRPANFETMAAKEQWSVDKALGILDWDGSLNK